MPGEVLAGPPGPPRSFCGSAGRARPPRGVPIAGAAARWRASPARRSASMRPPEGGRSAGRRMGPRWPRGIELVRVAARHGPGMTPDGGAAPDFRPVRPFAGRIRPISPRNRPQRALRAIFRPQRAARPREHFCSGLCAPLLLSAGRHSSKGVVRESPKETEVQAEVRCPSNTHDRQPPLSIRPPGFVSDGWRLEPGRGGLKRSHRLARIARFPRITGRIKRAR